ncbi:MAG: EAL domain-containing protein [Nitrospirae bacterium]|nr:EAL domain-containing protein [Nitrospirota bacterium]
MLTILVIDDDEVDRMAVVRALKAGGLRMEIEEATDGAAGLAALSRRTFDCAFLDFAMPGGDGLAALKKARAAGITTPIIMLTGHGDEHTAVEVMKAGAVDYLSKAALSAESVGRSLRHALRVHRAEQKAEESQRRWRLAAAVIDRAQEAVLTTDRGGTIEFVNPAFCDLTGYAPDEALGRNPRFLESERHDPAFYEALRRTLAASGSWRGEVCGRRKSGEDFPVWLTISAIHDERGALTHYAGMFADITPLKQAEARLKQLAHYDTLTGLPNRRLFHDRLQQAVALALRHERLVALLFVDLDGFKLLNDSLGHAVGDLALNAVAVRLTGCVRASDTVARMGGDEFTVLLDGVVSAEDAARVAQKILDAMEPPLTLQERECFLSASIGIAMYPSDALDADGLLRQADTAMYCAKAQGKHAYRFYKAELHTQALERVTLECGLRKAFTRGEFVVHYQPQVDLGAGGVLAVEALVRWQHPERGLLSAGRFIPLAEETGLIVPLGEWVLRTACAQTKTWQETGFAGLRIAVNLSARQLSGTQRDVADMVEQALRDTGLAPSCLELEITERSLTQDAETALATLRRLKALGVRLTLTGFGAGYSALGALQRFPLDGLKIAQDVVRDVTANPKSAAIVTASLALAHSLRLPVVAGGVETEEQAAWLTAHLQEQFGWLREHRGGMQGFYLSRPVPAEQVSPLLREFSLRGRTVGGER